MILRSDHVATQGRARPLSERITELHRMYLGEGRYLFKPVA